MKKIFLILLSLFLYANNTNFIKNLIGKEKFHTYYELIKPILNEHDLKKTIKYLKDNGLLDIFFNSPRNIHPTFIFQNNNPILETKILYKTLNYMGYYYFYPIKINNSTNYSITLEMKSTHYIDPLLFINTISQNGCKVTNIKKQKNYTYFINCENAYLNTLKVINKTTKLLNAKGIYWINPNGYRKIQISTSKYDNWYPYIVMFDKNLNILNIISKQNHQKRIILNIPIECKYIKISDTFTKENFKRGIYIKGIK